MRRAGRPESCTIDADDDVCLGCPHKMPPCAGIDARGLCPAIIAEAKGAKPRGDLDDAIRLTRGLPPRPRGLLPDLPADAFVTTARLLADTAVLLAALPADLDLVVAIPRSGLLPGSLIAFHRHLPLLTATLGTGVVDPGHGARLADPARPPRHVLLVDDTAAGGNEMRRVAPVVRAAFPAARLTRAVVYAHPQAVGFVDVFAARCPGLHYLEWNWTNAGHGAWTAYDFDGILCRDFTAEECRDDASYRAAMARIEPLYLPRRTPVPLIVTARPESTREITLAWLARHGVRCDRLVMRDWDFDPGRDWNRQVAEFKADHYGRSGCGYFAESEPAQAEAIHAITGRPVICPALGRVLGAPAW